MDSVGEEANNYIINNICNSIASWQLVPGVYYTKVWGMDGLRFAFSLAPSTMDIDRDDILELSMNLGTDGVLKTPFLVKRVARKAKDATKKSGCWWDGGKGATTAFISGGAVCDGWSWRDQKFASD